MPKYLKDAVKYSNKRISADEITLENYVTTDNLLQNKQGKTKVESLPPNGGNVTAYEEGDILISNIRPYLKKLWFANQSGGSSADVLTFKVKQGFEPKFIYYSVFRDLFFDHMMNGSKGTKMPRGDKNQILDFPIPNFPLSTQKSIAKVLSDLDAKIELNNKINRELEAMAKTLYGYWFVQFDFPNADGKPYKSSGGKMVYNAELKREIPEGWEVKKLGELVYQVTDSISPDEYPELPYLPIDKLPMKQLYYYEYESRSEANSSLIRFKENDILLGAMRVYFHRVCHAISDGISRSTIIVLRPFKENTKNFALFALNKNEAIEFATNNSTGTSIPYAKWNDSLENYLIGVPKTDYILILFNKIVNPILEKFKVQNKQTQQLTELRDWLLPMLMNGQVTVRQAHGKLETEERLNMAAEPSVKYGN